MTVTKKRLMNAWPEQAVQDSNRMLGPDLCKLIQIAENRWEEEWFHHVLKILGEQRQREGETFLLTYYTGLVNNRLVVYNLYTKKEPDNAKQYLQEAIKHLKQSIELLTDSSDAHALLGYAMGMKVAISGFRGILSGPRSQTELEKAIELDPQNPRAHLLRGISLYTKPAQIGGSVLQARRDLQEALDLFQRDKGNDGNIQWGHEEAWIWLSRCYEKLGDPTQAVITLRRAVEKFPSHRRLELNLKRVEGRP